MYGLYSVSGSSSTCLRYSSMDRFQSSIHGSSLNMPANSIQGLEGGPTSSSTSSAPFLSRSSIMARSLANASSRVAPLAETANGSMPLARKPFRATGSIRTGIRMAGPPTGSHDYVSFYRAAANARPLMKVLEAAGDFYGL